MEISNLKKTIITNEGLTSTNVLMNFISSKVETNKLSFFNKATDRGITIDDNGKISMFNEKDEWFILKLKELTKITTSPDNTFDAFYSDEEIMFKLDRRRNFYINHKTCQAFQELFYSDVVLFSKEFFEKHLKLKDITIVRGLSLIE